MNDNRKKRWVLVLATGVIATGCICLVRISRTVAEDDASAGTINAPATVAPPTNPLDGQRAYGYLQQICALGPRPSGSPGMQKQQSCYKSISRSWAAR